MKARSVSVISTASRGIGYEFTRQLLQRNEQTKVIALLRNCNLENNPAIAALIDKYPNRLLAVPVDLEDQQSIENVPKLITNTAQRLFLDDGDGGSSLPITCDLLVNVAGILGDGGVTAPGPERSVLKVDRDWMRKTFEVNLFGHVMLTQALLPIIKAHNSGGNNTGRPKIVNLSARVGSIADNNLGGWYSYRMSKAALNMFTKTLAVELKASATVISIHPGTTDTDLSKPFQRNVRADKLFTVEHSVSAMLDNCISKLEAKDSGKFFAYDGSEIPY